MTKPLNYIAFSRLRAFAKAVYPDFQDQAPHIKRISQALEDVEEGKIKRLMIFLPPRHGKSLLASEIFPAWFLGRNPEKQVIFVGYNSQFASGFGRKVRNHMGSENYRDIFQLQLLVMTQVQLIDFIQLVVVFTIQLALVHL